jgi:lysozyme family protein
MSNANANTAIPKMLVNEGGYNRAYNGSGETYKGIDRKYSTPWPEGWALIDEYKKRNTIRNEATIPIPRLNALVQDFYYKNIWPKSNAGKINNSEFSSFYFDFYVHKPAIAIECCNIIANSIRKVSVSSSTLSADVLSLINNNVELFYSKFYQMRLAHYKNNFLNSKYKVFYKSSQRGQLNRIAKYPSVIVDKNKTGETASNFFLQRWYAV